VARTSLDTEPDLRSIAFDRQKINGTDCGPEARGRPADLRDSQNRRDLNETGSGSAAWSRSAGLRASGIGATWTSSANFSRSSPNEARSIGSIDGQPNVDRASNARKLVGHGAGSTVERASI